MPWKKVSVGSQRAEFVALAGAGGANIRALCRSFGISPTTGYKWLARSEGAGAASLQDRSRRPHRSPRKTDSELEAAVLSVRDHHPSWGGRKIVAWLRNHGRISVAHPNTVTHILRRHGRLDPVQAGQHRPWQRFEYAAPNALWQTDFKGHVPLGARGGRLHPLTVMDDHSRFSLGLTACGDETSLTVQTHLTGIFRRYGLPDRMLMDNGPPFGAGSPDRFTPLTVWLLRLGIAVSHGRPHHPQTQGKEERFHRTLKAELLQGRVFGDLVEAQRAFDRWRDVYNLERPHEACGLAPPVSRYQVSARPFPETLPPIEYGPDDQVRKVQGKGEIHFRGKVYLVGKAFHGYPIALRPTQQDALWDAHFGSHLVTQISLEEPAES